MKCSSESFGRDNSGVLFGSSIAGTEFGRLWSREEGSQENISQLHSSTSGSDSYRVNAHHGSSPLSHDRPHSKTPEIKSQHDPSKQIELEGQST